MSVVRGQRTLIVSKERNPPSPPETLVDTLPDVTLHKEVRSKREVKIFRQRKAPRVGANT